MVGLVTKGRCQRGTMSLDMGLVTINVSASELNDGGISDLYTASLWWLYIGTTLGAPITHLTFLVARPERVKR